MLLEKTVYDKLVAKVNNIDTSGFVLKTKYDAVKSSIRKSMIQTKKVTNIKALVRKQILMLKLLKKKTEYLVLMV